MQETHSFFLDDDDDKGKNLIKTVQYVSNRAVIFPSRLWHMAEAPARQYGGIRTTVAYKMDIYKMDIYHK